MLIQKQLCQRATLPRRQRGAGSTRGSSSESPPLHTLFLGKPCWECQGLVCMWV